MGVTETKEELSQPASKGDIVRIHDQLNSFMVQMATLTANLNAQTQALNEHMKDHDKKISEVVDAKISTHEKTCSTGKDFAAFKNRINGAIVGAFLSGGTIGGGGVALLMKLLG